MVFSLEYTYIKRYLASYNQQINLNSLFLWNLSSMSAYFLQKAQAQEQVKDNQKDKRLSLHISLI